MDTPLLSTATQAAGPLAAEATFFGVQPAFAVILLLGVTLGVAAAMRSRLG